MCKFQIAGVLESLGGFETFQYQVSGDIKSTCIGPARCSFESIQSMRPLLSISCIHANAVPTIGSCWVPLKHVSSVKAQVVCQSVRCLTCEGKEHIEERSVVVLTGRGACHTASPDAAAAADAEPGDGAPSGTGGLATWPTACPSSGCFTANTKALIRAHYHGQLQSTGIS